MPAPFTLRLTPEQPVARRLRQGAGQTRPVDFSGVGFIRWLSRQLDDSWIEEEDTVEQPAEAADAETPTYPEFTGVLATQLEDDVRQVVDQLALPGDQAYGRLMLQALRSDSVEPPAMPEAVLRIQKMLSSPECDVGQLARAITHDPAIAGRFVGIANSPLYARADRVRTVDDAVVRIGLKQASMIVMAIVAKTKLFRAPGYEDRARLMHRHCLAAAVAGQIIARRARIAEELAFMGGLLHDIGRVWLLSLSAEVTRRSRGKDQVGPEAIDTISDRFHAAFGALVVETWGFEEDLVAALMYHHVPSQPGPDNTLDVIPRDALALTCALAAADLVSHILLETAPVDREALDGVFAQLGFDYDPDLRGDCKTAFVEFERYVA